MVSLYREINAKNLSKNM